MKMEADEIVALYKANPTRETMQKIAKANDCTIHEVGEFLRDCANKSQEVKKRRGRPKKDKAQSRNSTSTQKTKKDNSEKTEIKNESEEAKKRPHSYLIPDLVAKATKEKVEELRRMGRIHSEKAEECFMLANECEDFLNGGYYNGQEDGLFR